MKNGDERKSKNGLTFEDFASQSFKVGKSYAKQALAIADFLRGRIYNRRKKAKNDGGKGTSKASVDQIDPQSTAEQVAAETGVSPATFAPRAPGENRHPRLG